MEKELDMTLETFREFPDFGNENLNAVYDALLVKYGLESNRENIVRGFYIDHPKNAGMSTMSTDRTQYALGLNVLSSTIGHAGVISHELWHIKQMVTGRLTYEDSGTVLFEGKPEPEEYLEQGAEIEAFSHQVDGYQVALELGLWTRSDLLREAMYDAMRLAEMFKNDTVYLEFMNLSNIKAKV